MQISKPTKRKKKIILNYSIEQRRQKHRCNATAKLGDHLDADTKDKLQAMKNKRIEL